MHQTIQKIGRALVVRGPRKFVEQNGLSEGSRVKVTLAGSTLVVQAHRRQRYKLEDLLAEMRGPLPIYEAWENMPPVGREMT